MVVHLVKNCVIDIVINIYTQWNSIVISQFLKQWDSGQNAWLQEV